MSRSFGSSVRGAIEGSVRSLLVRLGLLTAAGAPVGDASALKIASNLADLGTVATARTNLGLGTAAELNHGTANGNLVRLDAIGLPAIDGSQLTGLASGSSAYTLVATEAELTAALAASAPLIAITANITLIGDRNVSVDTVILIPPGSSLGMGGFLIICAAGVTVELQGLGSVSGLGITPSSFSLGAGAILRATQGLSLVFGGAATGWTPAEQTNFNNVSISFFNGNGVQDITTNSLSSRVSMRWIGGGATCRNAGVLTGCHVSGLRIGGSFQASVFAYTMNNMLGLVDIEDRAIGAHAAFFKLMNSAAIGTNIRFQLSTGQVQMQGCFQGVSVPVGSLAPISDGITDTRITSGLARVLDGAPVRTFISDLEFIDLFGVGNVGTQFLNCRFRSGVQLLGDDMSVIGGFCGNPTLPGGTATVSINLGADRSRVVGVATDVAISSFGAGTVVAANTIF